MASYLISGMVMSIKDGVRREFLVRAEAGDKRQAERKFWAGDYQEVIGNGGLIVTDSMIIEKEKI